MPFRKVDEKERVSESIKNDPEFEKYYNEAQSEISKIRDIVDNIKERYKKDNSLTEEEYRNYINNLINEVWDEYHTQQNSKNT